MPPANIWVVKLGGAMLAAEQLPAWLAACSGDDARAVRCIVVAGGGVMADEVRALQARWHFDDGLAHELALDTMRINARLLQALAPGLARRSATTRAELPALKGCGGMVWTPAPNFAPPELPASWAVTSDSIALWLAQTLGAQALLLVKSLAPEQLRCEAAASLAEQGIVDDYFPTLLAQGKTPTRLLSKLSVGDFERHRRSGTLPGVAVELD